MLTTVVVVGMERINQQGCYPVHCFREGDVKEKPLIIHLDKQDARTLQKAAESLAPDEPLLLEVDDKYLTVSMSKMEENVS